MAEALLATDLTLPNKRIGKVRDLYDVTLASGDEALLIMRPIGSAPSMCYAKRAAR